MMADKVTRRGLLGRGLALVAGLWGVKMLPAQEVKGRSDVMSLRKPLTDRERRLYEDLNKVMPSLGRPPYWYSVNWVDDDNDGKTFRTRCAVFSIKDVAKVFDALMRMKANDIVTRVFVGCRVRLHGCPMCGNERGR